MILRANPIGPPVARRYVIQNMDDGMVWNGEEFVAPTEDVLKDGVMKYATPSAACADMQAILRIVHGDKPCQRFIVPIEIEVYGDVSKGSVARWLSRSAVLNMRTHEFGNGPGEDSLVLPVVHWGLIKSIPRPVFSLENLDNPDDPMSQWGEEIDEEF